MNTIYLQSEYKQPTNQRLFACRLLVVVSLILSYSSVLQAANKNDEHIGKDNPAIAQTKTKIDSQKLAKLQQKISVERYFQDIVTDIDTSLINNQKILKIDKKQLEAFVNNKILTFWNSELTLKQLLGSSNWKKLTKKQVVSLTRIFDETLQRYVREGMEHYEGQRVELVEVRLSSKAPRGLVTIELQPNYLPAFNVTFKIANDQGKWRLYDVLVEGISYVKMKKNEFRQIIAKQGLQALIDYLDNKNKV